MFNIGTHLANGILLNHDHTHQPTFNEINKTSLNSFVILETDESEILPLHIPSAPNWDSISTRFLNIAKKQITPVISHLTLSHLCFKSDNFRRLLKQSIITLIYKTGDKCDIGNYRPISVLPSTLNILEKKKQD